MLGAAWLADGVRSGGRLPSLQPRVGLGGEGEPLQCRSQVAHDAIMAVGGLSVDVQFADVGAVAIAGAGSRRVYGCARLAPQIEQLIKMWRN